MPSVPEGSTSTPERHPAGAVSSSSSNSRRITRRAPRSRAADTPHRSATPACRPGCSKAWRGRRCSPPRPSSRYSPNPSSVSSRATPASAWLLTMLLRNLARSPRSCRDGAGRALDDHQAEHRVAEQFQALVGRQATVLVGVAAVGQGQCQQVVGEVCAERLDEVLARHDGVPPSGPPSSGRNRASLAHRGSMLSWW